MIFPTLKQIQAQFDCFNAARSAMQSQIVDLYDKPWELLQAAEQVRLCDLEWNRYLVLLGAACGFLAEDSGSLDEIEGMLRWKNDNPSIVDRWNEDADYRRALRKVAS